ncbi:hypothetical protein [Streptomyces erythrochromogenes]|uniref:hypothetical protein n=1 Tax=Streptomyces erythrochromogenes TaxID=285574 RepID=UPI0037017E79
MDEDEVLIGRLVEIAGERVAEQRHLGVLGLAEEAIECAEAGPRSGRTPTLDGP